MTESIAAWRERHAGHDVGRRYEGPIRDREGVLSHGDRVVFYLICFTCDDKIKVDAVDDPDFRPR